MKIFLDRLDKSVLKKGFLVNIKVVYFTQDSNSNHESVQQLQEYLSDYKNKYPNLKFQFIEADGPFSRGKGKYWVDLFPGIFMKIQVCKSGRKAAKMMICCSSVTLICYFLPISFKGCSPM